MGRSTYLTVRCPTGCEVWLHPLALPRHVEGGRCRGRPWVDDLPDTAAIPPRYAPLLLSVLDESLLGVVGTPGSTRVQWPDGRRRIPSPMHSSRWRMRSPLEGVPARRWLAVAVAAADRWGSDGVRQALEPDRFEEFETQLLPPGAYVICPICGAFIHARHLRQHQSMNAACLWRRAAAEVRCAWSDGWRDPWSIPGAPTTWAELSATVRWARRLRTIPFPRWVAVLLPVDNLGTLSHAARRAS
jgi:hypothetical protein